jgi:hypothetical protein
MFDFRRLYFELCSYKKLVSPIRPGWQKRTMFYWLRTLEQLRWLQPLLHLFYKLPNNNYPPECLDQLLWL